MYLSDSNVNAIAIPALRFRNPEIKIANILCRNKTYYNGGWLFERDVYNSTNFMCYFCKCRSGENDETSAVVHLAVSTDYFITLTAMLAYWK
jgi:hypothetical protein